MARVRAFGRAMADEEKSNVRATDVDEDLDQLLDRTCSDATEVDAHVSHDETALSTDGNATTTSLMGTHHALRRHVGRVARARCTTEGSQGMHVHDDASGRTSRSAIRSAGQEDYEPSRPKCTCTATAAGTRRIDGRNQQQLVEAL